MPILNGTKITLISTAGVLGEPAGLFEGQLSVSGGLVPLELVASPGRTMANAYDEVSTQLTEAAITSEIVTEDDRLVLKYADNATGVVGDADITSLKAKKTTYSIGNTVDESSGTIAVVIEAGSEAVSISIRHNVPGNDISIQRLAAGELTDFADVQELVVKATT